MSKEFRLIAPDALQENFIKLIGSDWMLITAGRKESFNTMTAAWGSIGYLWNRPIAVCFVRPTRYTYGFMEKNNEFTLSFFAEEYRQVLNVCGSTSGKDSDKIKETGLIPLETASSNIYFEQARLVIECRKIYADDIVPEKFIDKSIEKNYPLKDYHRMYIGEIMQCLKSE
jgi:flavin reductase (DIM6/NTAB) family NADH-FMN oxidoreductase RutF